MEKNVYYKIKMIFDICCAFTGCLLLSPFLLLAFILIKMDSKGPVFFKQERVGKNGKLFFIYKLRTMYVDKNNREPKVAKESLPRITKVGKFFRKYKIDELPQLFNVLRGDMSLVGSRPELTSYVTNFKKQYNEILKIKPGITDYASLKYINEGTLLNEAQDLEEKYNNEILPLKLYYNLKYLEEQNFLIDIKIILKTIWAIIKKGFVS